MKDRGTRIWKHEKTFSLFYGGNCTDIGSLLGWDHSDRKKHSDRELQQWKWNFISSFLLGLRAAVRAFTFEIHSRQVDQRRRARCDDGWWMKWDSFARAFADFSVHAYTVDDDDDVRGRNEGRRYEFCRWILICTFDSPPSAPSRFHVVFN